MSSRVLKWLARIALALTIVATIGITTAHSGIVTTPGQNGTATTISVSNAIIGDFKWGYQTTDHNGWIAMDGRPLLGFTSTQRAAASSFGLTGNLPNITQRGIVATGGGYVLGTLVGNASASIAQTNLPNIALTVGGSSAGTPSGTIDTQGSHTHAATVTFHDNTGGGFNGGRIQSTDRNPTRVQANAAEVQIQSAGSHSHNFTGNSLPTHTHSVTLGGGGVPIGLQDPALVLNGFIYLGA
jgi:hypothetical protein